MPTRTHTRHPVVRSTITVGLAVWLTGSALAGSALAQDSANYPELKSPLFRDAISTTNDQRWVGEPVSMSLKDADLVEVLRTFARLSELNMILHPGIKGKVTVELKDVPWDQALSMILKMHGLGMDITQGTLRVAKPQALRKMIEAEAQMPAPSIIPTYRVRGELQYLDAAMAAELLNRMDQGYLTRKGKAEAEPRSNILVVDDLRRRLEDVSQMIADLDRPEAANWDERRLRAEADAWWRRHIGTGGF